MLIRGLEILIDKLFCNVFEHLLGIMNYMPVIHHEHPLYSKSSYNAEFRTVESDLVKDGDVVLYSGGSFLDYVFLTEKYSPVFLTIAKDEAGDNVNLNFNIWIGSTGKTELG